MKKLKSTNKGITLIALVITIIVMLILVAVTISMAVNGRLFEYASNAGTQTNAAVDAEQELGSGIIRVGNKTYASIDAYIANDPIDQEVIVDETLTNKQITLEIEEGYNVQTSILVTKKLNPTIIGIEGIPTWKSSDETVAKVDETGLVTAIGPGTAEISVSVTYRDVTFTDKCTATVVKKEPKIITFWIGNYRYQAEEGMTWEKFAKSPYNTAGCRAGADGIVYIGPSEENYFVIYNSTDSRLIPSVGDPIEENYHYKIQL